MIVPSSFADPDPGPFLGTPNTATWSSGRGLHKTRRRRVTQEIVLGNPFDSPLD